jgi:hypothetical protein
VFNTLHRYHPTGEPTPKYASDAEIELAEQLRRRLEERYRETPATPSSLKNNPSQ